MSQLTQAQVNKLVNDAGQAITDLEAEGVVMRVELPPAAATAILSILQRAITNMPPAMLETGPAQYCQAFANDLDEFWSAKDIRLADIIALGWAAKPNPTCPKCGHNEHDGVCGKPVNVGGAVTFCACNHRGA